MMAFQVACLVFAGILSGTNAVNSLRFLVLGDMGGLPISPYYTKIEQGTAKEMAAVAERYQPQFILAVGDNFYYSGVKNVEDKRFLDTFEHVYSAPSLQVPWYLIAGNHDHNGNVTAQIEYSKKSKRWNFPDYYYPLSFALPDGSGTVDLVMMDTILLAGGVLHDFFVHQPAGAKDHLKAETQWAWIEQNLQKSTGKYLFSVGHYPIYSVAEHGPTHLLVDRLLPLLVKYRANGHMCGHDHNLQHLRTTKDGVTVDMILSGAANFIDSSTAHKNSVPPGVSLFHWADKLSLGGFVYAEATSSNMTLSYMDASGKLLYHTTIFPRK